MPDNIITEAETRQALIDTQLKAAGWDVNNLSQVRRELPLPVAGRQIRESASDYLTDSNSANFADYVLFKRNGKPIAIVEAKRTSRDPLTGERQAEEYADRIQTQYGVSPIIFLANGKKIWLLDQGRYPVREVSGFYTPDDLDRLDFQRRFGEQLTELGAQAEIVNRDYQTLAVKTVTESIASGHRRNLLVMATGTGKTRTAIAIIEVLMRAKWAQRVLFLADRRELARQALSAFKEFLSHESRDRIEGGEINHGARIHVAIYPSMMQVYRQLSVGYYDLIIADESHRSIYNDTSYQKLFTHFDALLLGLTATPTDFIDHNTFDLFNCADGKPTFEYGYARAVDEGHLAQYRVLESKTKFQLEGIKAGQLPPEIQRQLVEQGIDPSEVNFEGTDLEKRVTNTGTNEAIAAEIVEKCRRDASGTLPAKTIIFAMSHAHALELYKAFNKRYPEWQRRGLARVIDSQMERAEIMLDDFKFRDMPRVAISVDMLDTGIDVPSIQNLVFAKPVFSQVKFWQMIGRGTRLWVDPQTAERKTDFFVLDFWDNFAYFNLNPQGERANAETPLPVRLFRLRLEKLLTLRGLNKLTEATDTATQLRSMLMQMPTDNALVRQKSDELEKYLATDLSTLDDMSGINALAPLLRFMPEVNFNVMGFEVRTEELTTAQLSGNAESIERLHEKVLGDLDRLPTGLPEVQAQAEKMAWVRGAGFWEFLDYSRVMELQTTFAPLMRFRQPQTRQIIHLNLPDKIVQRMWVAYGPTGEGAFVETYRAQVEAYLRDLTDQVPALQKLQRGEDLLPADVQSLAAVINRPDLFVTEDNLRQAYEQPDTDFVKLLGHALNPNHFPLETREQAIAKSFEEFIAAHPQYRASQLQFIRLVRAAVINHTRLTMQELLLPPFTRVGLADRLFSSPELDEILMFANQLAE
ncbi:MAG: DEAD/DEAH box helicase family protein [Chloroflexi bacterium]|nr:DEAD/DEAH box helicase family protein [Chloroflexota bacterium]